MTSNNFYGSFPESTSKGEYSDITNAAILMRFSWACGILIDENSFKAAYF